MLLVTTRWFLGEHLFLQLLRISLLLFGLGVNIRMSRRPASTLALLGLVLVVLVLVVLVLLVLIWFQLSIVSALTTKILLILWWWCMHLPIQRVWLQCQLRD
jgi:hypothetical protein